MRRIEQAFEVFLETLRESEEYVRYQNAKKALHEHPELEYTVHEFRKKNYQIQNSGNVNLFDEVDRLERENTEIRRNPVVEEYLAAEIAFCRLIQTINWRLIEGLDFEVGFVNE